MSLRFTELDWRETPIGAVSLRRRHDPALGVDVFEVKLDDDFLMSSAFTVAEVELARLGLSAVEDAATQTVAVGGDGASSGGASVGGALDVVVGGLGLGYTAHAALADPRVRSLTVVEAVEHVIDWHRRRLLPVADELVADPRTRLVQGDFFALVREGRGLDPDAPGRRHHAVLLDIDHTPRHVLHPSHADFYEPSGLRRLAECLHPGGVFALWSDDPPDAEFAAVLGEVFAEARAHVVTFPNPYTGESASNTVYVARRVG